ncbi:MAG TPA: sulfite exporter TauE/SafE family protein [Baekduia sp.]|nr:sulfite exporter TauE/SafE family protein [Baekduia sp.]
MTTVLLGLLAGLLAGMLGIGGGAIFVPALVIVVGLSQLEAEATSLLAIVPVALVGAWRQHGYGNVRLREGLLLGAVAVPGALVGVAVVNAVPERAVEVGFACLLLVVAAQLARRGLRPAPQPPSGDGPSRPSSGRTTTSRS